MIIIVIVSPRHPIDADRLPEKFSSVFNDLKRSLVLFLMLCNPPRGPNTRPAIERELECMVSRSYLPCSFSLALGIAVSRGIEVEYCKPEPGELITNMHYINRIVFTHTAAGSARASPQQRSAQLVQCCLQRLNELLRHRYASMCNALMKIQQIH